jgi:hypothetical protein
VDIQGEEQAPNLCHTNEVVAAYVACGVRMHLYAHLDKLGKRAVYYDTDSVIFVKNTDEPPLKECGEALVDMTSELSGKSRIQDSLAGA